MTALPIRLFSVACGLCLCHSLLAQVPTAGGVPRVKGFRMAAKPLIDGVIDPQEWASVPMVTGLIDPYTAKPVADQSEVRIGYDAEAIYVAFKGFDSQPDRMVGREITPNSEFEGEDTFKVAINPFHTRSGSGLSSFMVNLLGTQNEAIAGGRASKREWRGEWSAATKRLSDGWSCEMRIPWKILNFSKSSTIDLDLNFVRYQARTQIESKWADTTPAVRLELIGIWEGVQPPAIAERRKIEGLAYLAPGYDDKRGTYNAGADLRYKFNQELTGLLSISPDFKNIESQVAGIDFSRTERFLDDSRPFFNEGSDFFSLTGQFGFGRMFYSRRIEDFDVATKFFGQVAENLRVGALLTRETGEETAGVVNISKGFGPNANVSAYSTFREANGVQNSSYGLNHDRRMGNFSYGFQLVSETKSQETSNSAGSLSISYSVPKVFSNIRYTWIEPDFQPELAYIPYTDRRGVYNYTEISNQYRTGPLRSLDANIFTTYYEHYDATVMQLGTEAYISGVTRGDTEISLGRSSVAFDGELDNIYSFGLTANQSNRYRRLRFGIDDGTRGGVRSTFYNIGGSLRTFRKLDLGLSFSQFKQDSIERQMIASASYTLSPTRSVSGRAVFQGDKTNAYVAYRNSGAKGTELFVILGDPNAEETRTRLSVKMVWAF
ncbi:MAG: DUF5916 domain-containing protein [Fimbriimonas sp.]